MEAMSHLVITTCSSLTLQQFLKVIAFGFKPYFYSFRNWVDCLLSLYSAIYCICALVVLFENDPDGQESPVLTYENLADMALASAVLRCLTILGKYVSGCGIEGCVVC